MSNKFGPGLSSSPKVGPRTLPRTRALTHHFLLCAFHYLIKKVVAYLLQWSTISYFVSLMKTWDLAKKSHFAWVLSTEAVNANFLHTMIIYIENGVHSEILKFSVKWICKLTPGTTVNVYYATMILHNKNYWLSILVGYNVWVEYQVFNAIFFYHKLSSP